MENYMGPSLFGNLSVDAQPHAVTPCQRCQGSAMRSRRAFVKNLFESEPDTIFTLRGILRRAESAGEFCKQCTPENRLSLQIYHLRQDGVAEKVGVSQFRYRRSDADTPDFVYARRRRKE